VAHVLVARTHEVWVAQSPQRDHVPLDKACLTAPNRAERDPRAARSMPTKAMQAHGAAQCSVEREVGVYVAGVRLTDDHQ
jgi:hypothetical protein